MQDLLQGAVIELSNRNWKVVRQFVWERSGISLSSSSCLNYLHRLGFVLKCPKKRLLKADEETRESFVVKYIVLKSQAQETGEKIFFVDEAHFRADAELGGKWVQRGDVVRECLRKTSMNLRLVNLPGSSPDFNADEAIWGWVREEATGNLCLGSANLVRQRVCDFLSSLSGRKEEAKRRCRTILQSKAEDVLLNSQHCRQQPNSAHPTLALV